jgi:outer membrane protein assembly factor BamB
MGAMLVSGSPVTAADWPGWRGPQRDGKSTEQGLATQWPEQGPPLLWKIENAGEGFSTPSVVQDRIYLMGNRDGEEWVLAMDARANGKQLWATSLGKVRHNGSGYPGPRSTPTIAGQRLYTLGMNGDLVCLKVSDGELLWRRDLVGEFGGKIPNWGYSESVLVDGPWVVCTPGGEQTTLVALDKSSGETIWKSPGGNDAAYASPIGITVDGVKHYVQFTSSGVVGVAARDGHDLWRYDAPSNGTANVATPLNQGRHVFAASGYGTGGGRVDLRSEGNGFVAEETYFTRDMKNHHGGLILHERYIYGCNDPRLLSCLDWRTGEVVWRNRTCGKCSLLMADGMLIARSDDGQVSLVKADPEGFELRGRFEQPEEAGPPTWPHPVISGGRLYLRDQNLLFCYDVSESATE